MMPTVIFGGVDHIILVLRPFFKTFFQASEAESDGTKSYKDI